MPNLLLPPFAFLVMLGLAWGLMALAKSVAAKSRPEQGKERLYACGEEAVPQAVQPNYSGFFAVAFAYSVIHVAALTLAMIPSGAGSLGLVYLGLVLFAVVALVTELELI